MYVILLLSKSLATLSIDILFSDLLSNFQTEQQSKILSIFLLTKSRQLPGSYAPTHPFRIEEKKARCSHEQQKLKIKEYELCLKEERRTVRETELVTASTCHRAITNILPCGLKNCNSRKRAIVIPAKNVIPGGGNCC